MKLPIKTRVLQYGIDKNAPFDAAEVAEVLEKEYKGERTATKKNIEKIISTYCGVGIMKAVSIEFADGSESELALTYKVMEFGKNCKKMIPDV